VKKARYTSKPLCAVAHHQNRGTTDLQGSSKNGLGDFQNGTRHRQPKGPFSIPWNPFQGKFFHVFRVTLYTTLAKVETPPSDDYKVSLVDWLEKVTAKEPMVSAKIWAKGEIIQVEKGRVFSFQRDKRADSSLQVFDFRLLCISTRFLHFDPMMSLRAVDRVGTSIIRQRQGRYYQPSRRSNFLLINSHVTQVIEVGQTSTRRIETASQNEIGQLDHRAGFVMIPVCAR